jgi:hypothetical protein
MQLSKSYAEVLAWEQARVGLSGLPREWTPSSWDNSDNDCAVFQSKALFGDIRYYVVSQFYNDGRNAGQLVPAAVPGALACYRWPGSDDNFDHIGLVVGGQDGNGNFTSLEANTSGPVSGHQVAVKTRNVSNVVGFVMPLYAGVQPAGGGAGPLPDPPTVKANKMKFWRQTNGTLFYGAYAIPNMTVYNLLVRYDSGINASFNAAERDMIKLALQANGMPG